MRTKRFSFRLGAVLKAKEIAERMRIRELAVANAHYLTECSRLEALNEECRHVGAQILDKGIPKSKAGEAMMWRGYLFGLGDRAEEQKAKIKQASEHVEEKREKVVAASKEKKILERLKDRRLAEYLVHLGQSEQAEMDEVAERRWQSDMSFGVTVHPPPF